jgi:hypothetical protein
VDPVGDDHAQGAVGIDDVDDDERIHDRVGPEKPQLPAN